MQVKRKHTMISQFIIILFHFVENKFYYGLFITIHKVFYIIKNFFKLSKIV